MKKEFIEAGKIVGTHGVRGMVRIQPWADSVSFLCGFNMFYLGDDKALIMVNKIKPHGNIVIAEIDGIDSIEKAETLRNRMIFIKRSDVDIPENRYFIDELIGCRVLDFDTGREYGLVTDVSATGANDVWHIKNGEKEYLLPAIKDVVKRVDTDGEIIEICPIKGIFDDEN
ncbi:MAG: 16S rRNA processing protein RimM [Clostridia bacterium]|nr:16S rRNA processing protein RimM [Clostridia bacterium]